MEDSTKINGESMQNVYHGCNKLSKRLGDLKGYRHFKSLGSQFPQMLVIHMILCLLVKFQKA